MSRYDWGKKHAGIESLRQMVEPARASVMTHPIYGQLSSLQDVRTFTENHVFAVWDFMSLLKNLQAQLTCVDVPWVPRGAPASRRLINEIVLAEESGEVAGGHSSHFESYLAGMERLGAGTGPVNAFLGLIGSGAPLPSALRAAKVPPAAAAFVTSTWDILCEAPLHAQAAAFAFGREDLIPGMFHQMVEIEDRTGQLSMFRDHLTRHLEGDGEQHTPMAMAMLAELCGNDQAKWYESADIAIRALHARARLWDGITAALGQRPEASRRSA
jgi:hypothetical protein